ncbi:hypothetical protein J6590_040011 [Homalodisca vitripennis]|nr:hypothetical protein J6590_040011 [Homalodisca vitripennis]
MPRQEYAHSFVPFAKRELELMTGVVAVPSIGDDSNRGDVRAPSQTIVQPLHPPTVRNPLKAGHLVRVNHRDLPTNAGTHKALQG